MNHYVSSFVCALSAVALSSASAADPVSFRNDVMAAISKAGCNLGTCHGNATGKGRFKLSLRSQDPELDFKALAREVSGRRVDLFAPERSLILVKGANQIAHEGGKKLDPKNWELLGPPHPRAHCRRSQSHGSTPRLRQRPPPRAGRHHLEPREREGVFTGAVKEDHGISHDLVG